MRISIRNISTYEGNLRTIQENDESQQRFFFMYKIQ